MATGSPGANGVWQYGEDDSEPTFSQLLNKAASTTDTQIGLDRERITDLEASAPGTAGRPFRNSAGSVTTSTAGAVTVTFPVGRFTVAPIINAANATGSAAATMPYISSPTAASFGISLFNVSGTRVAQLAHWTAVQMTSTTAAG
jgi:hypothetical protein